MFHKFMACKCNIIQKGRNRYILENILLQNNYNAVMQHTHTTLIVNLQFDNINNIKDITTRSNNIHRKTIIILKLLK